jgi:hypothetical protein
MHKRCNIDTKLTSKAIGILRRHPARVAKLTQLLLIGSSWRSVRNTMLLTHEQFDDLLDAAVYKAHKEAMQDPDVGGLGPFDWPSEHAYRSDEDLKPGFDASR